MRTPAERHFDAIERWRNQVRFVRWMRERKAASMAAARELKRGGSQDRYIRSYVIEAREHSRTVVAARKRLRELQAAVNQTLDRLQGK